MLWTRSKQLGQHTQENNGRIFFHPRSVDPIDKKRISRRWPRKPHTRKRSSAASWLRWTITWHYYGRHLWSSVHCPPWVTAQCFIQSMLSLSGAVGPAVGPGTSPARHEHALYPRKWCLGADIWEPVTIPTMECVWQRLLGERNGEMGQRV